MKQKWDSSNIAGIYLDEVLQIFDGAHRIFALKTLSKEEFEGIFGAKGEEGTAGGPRISLYKDIEKSLLVFLSQSKNTFFHFNFDRF